jgi:hypothetical protein
MEDEEKRRGRLEAPSSVIIPLQVEEKYFP